MSTEKTDPSGKQALDAVLQQAKAILTELTEMQEKLKDQARILETYIKDTEPIVSAAASQSEKAVNAHAEIDKLLKNSQESASKLDENGKKLKELLEGIEKIKAKTEDELKSAEIARKKADDEALYASQAKNNSELHAKTVASFKGQAEGDFATITINRQKSDELLQAITARKISSESDATLISNSRVQIEKASESISKAAEDGIGQLLEVEESKVKTLAIGKEAATVRDEILQARNKTNDAESDAVRSSTRAKELVSEISGDHESSNKQTNEIKDLLKSAKADDEALGEILQRLTKSNEIAVGYEQRVAKSSDELDSLIKKVEGLLPGATSAGLASAFNAQRIRFAVPQRRWLWTFGICIGILVVVSVPSFYKAAFGSVENKWNEVLIGLAMRLPVALPLVWLAIYAGRNYMLSVRLEEEYAHKEAISRSFEGYKREMEKITAGDAGNPTPLTTLCENILEAIAERPGRIYETKHQDLTVLSEMKDAAERADDFRKTRVATQ